MQPKMCMLSGCGKFVDADDFEAAKGWIFRATVVTSAGPHNGYDACSPEHLAQIAEINEANYQAMLAERAAAQEAETPSVPPPTG